MRKKSALLLLAFFGLASSAYGADIAAARLSLKNYALAHCIANQFSDKSDLRDDIGSAIGMYGFMGGGCIIFFRMRILWKHYMTPMLLLRIMFLLPMTRSRRTVSIGIRKLYFMRA